MRGDSASAPDSDATDGRSPRALAYLPWFTGDFMTATRGWSVTARGVYRELLDAQWDRGALPADPRALRQMIGATPTEWRTWTQFVEAKFPIGADGLRRNPRLEHHRAKSLRVSAVRREIGRRGGAASAERRAVITAIRGGNGA